MLWLRIAFAETTHRVPYRGSMSQVVNLSPHRQTHEQGCPRFCSGINFRQAGTKYDSCRNLNVAVKWVAGLAPGLLRCINLILYAGFADLMLDVSLSQQVADKPSTEGLAASQ